MNPPRDHHGGVTRLGRLGRGFWIGILASLALHGLLFSTGRFQMPRWGDAPALDARIEPVEFSAIPLPEPEAPSTPATPARVRPEPSPEPSSSPEPAPDIPVPPLMAPVETEASVPSKPEPVLPLPEAKPPPASSQPYALLAGAAERIRNLPAHIEIVYELNGMLSGRQTHVWQLAGQRYTLKSEGEVTGLAGLFVRGKMIQKSHGRIGSLGLMPEQYEMQRLSGKKETLQFDYAANTIESTRTDSRRNTRTLELPLLTGAQDPLSSIYQLAMVAQGGRDGLIVTVGSKRVKGYPYRMLGTETLRTPLGEMETLHVVRAGDSEKSGTHLWLAPEQHSLPVKVRYVDDEGTEWVLVATSIKTR